MSFVTYKKVYDKIELDSFLDLLKKHAIPFEVEDVLRNFNPAMTPRDGSIEMRIKIHPTDFEEVIRLETELLSPLLDQVDTDYYLFTFNEKELKDIIKNRSEWSLFDVLLAEKILLENGAVHSEKEIDFLKEETNNYNFEEKSVSSIQLIVIYFISIFVPLFGLLLGYILMVILPLLGLILGYYFMSHKKTFPDGSQKYVYNKLSRLQGKIITFIASFILLIIFILLVFFIDIDPSFL
jgi:hypothetical protein